jgi:hypothetical protein
MAGRGQRAVAESTFCSPFPSFGAGEQGRGTADLRNQRKWGQLEDMEEGRKRCIQKRSQDTSLNPRF